jgi:hypothetical protein
MAPKIPFIKNKKRKTEEQLRREKSSAGSDPNRIPNLSFYPTSSHPIKQNPASGSSSQQLSKPQGQDNPEGSSSQAIICLIAAPPLGPPATFDFKFSR